jgi:hypothetical protein
MLREHGFGEMGTGLSPVEDLKGAGLEERAPLP